MPFVALLVVTVIRGQTVAERRFLVSVMITGLGHFKWTLACLTETQTHNINAPLMIKVSSVEGIPSSRPLSTITPLVKLWYSLDPSWVAYPVLPEGLGRATLPFYPCPLRPQSWGWPVVIAALVEERGSEQAPRRDRGIFEDTQFTCATVLVRELSATSWRM